MPDERDDAGASGKGRRPEKRFEHRPGQRRPNSAQQLGHPQQDAVFDLLPDARRRRRAVHQHGAADAVGIRGRERAADHAAPRVTDEVRALYAKAVEDVEDAAGTIVETEWRRQLLTSTEARRVYEDDLMFGAEVVGLRRPHVAGHQQAWPKEDGRTRTASADVHPPQRGVDLLLLHRWHGSPPTAD